MNTYEISNAELIADWANRQNFTDWRMVTLKYPSFGDASAWRKALVHTFRELEQTFLRGSLLKVNKANGTGMHLRRLVALGGEKLTDTVLHAHCLVDGIGNDEKFEAQLKKAWRHGIARAIEKSCAGQFNNKDANIWVHKTSGCCRNYVEYMFRHEGMSLGLGMEKFVENATYLN